MTTEERLSSLETKFDLFMEELKQQREDIRRLNERQDATQAKHDADIKEMNQRFDAKFDRLSEQIHTMTIAAVVGFGAIVAAIGGLIVAAIK